MGLFFFCIHLHLTYGIKHFLVRTLGLSVLRLYDNVYKLTVYADEFVQPPTAKKDSVPCLALHYLCDPRIYFSCIIGSFC